MRWLTGWKKLKRGRAINNFDESGVGVEVEEIESECSTGCNATNISEWHTLYVSKEYARSSSILAGAASFADFSCVTMLQQRTNQNVGSGGSEHT
jgi:hypothetical protein